MDDSVIPLTQQDVERATRPLHIAALPPPVPLSDVDLYAARPWILGPCIRPGDCVYVVGRAGHGKSTFVADLLVSLLDPTNQISNPSLGPLHGTALAGAWKINRRLFPTETRAAIINAETSGPDDWAYMVRDTLTQHGHAPASTAFTSVLSKIHFFESQDLGLRRDHLTADAEALAHALIHAGYGIVVIDPVYDAFSPRDNADATWVFDGLSPFVRILKHAGILSMMIAHPSSVSRSFGAKGGPTLEQAFSPFGSEKQISVIDALFGIDRLPGENTIRVIKFKSRRAGSWVQNRAEFKLTFGKEGGYSAFSFSGEPWPYENPKRVTIPAAALRLLARLPVDTQFWLDPSKDGKPIRHKDFRENFTLYYEPLDLLRPVENGRRKEYQWTDLGRQAREDGLKLRAKERREAKAKGDAK
jgi:hypothetical protein